MGGGNAIVREGRGGRERSKGGTGERNGEKDEAECMLDSMANLTLHKYLHCFHLAMNKCSSHALMHMGTGCATLAVFFFSMNLSL